MTADIITLSRIPLSLLLLAFQTSSAPFTVLYLICGATDVLDGYAARRLHTESERGAMLDTAADLLFAVVYAVKILPSLSIPLWIWIWVALIAAVKTAEIVSESRKAHRLTIDHSLGNRLTGMLLFLLPLSVRFADVSYGATLACIAATVTAITEIKPGGIKK